MNDQFQVTETEVDALWNELNQAVERSGYHLNPDPEFSRELSRSLVVNEKRYGYRACPCRLATGNKDRDLDIICPCDYRDPDLNDFDSCYCALYVSEAVVLGKKTAQPIPERRGSKPAGLRSDKVKTTANLASLAYPVWRCKVCGYLCARENPPGTCPICKAGSERFEKFIP